MVTFGVSWIANKIKRYRRIGLSLSGGGLRGVGHIGALQALIEHGYTPQAIAGCSAGAIVGALFAEGYTPEEILKIAEDHNLFPVTSLRLRKTGFIDTGFLIDIFKKYIPHNTFEKLAIPLHVAANNLLTGETDYLREGPLDEALLATSSIPFMFSPVLRDELPYYDGGILDNMPIAPLKGDCNFLIGVHVNALDTVAPSDLTPMKTFDRIIHMAITPSVKANSKHCDLFIEPPGMLQFGMFDKKKQRDIYEYVYNYTSDFLSHQ